LQTLASTYHALKENEKAIEIYEKLVRLKPKDHEIRAFLGYLYYENEDLDKAEENLNKRENITLLTSVTAEEITKSEDGKISGVKAKGSSGNTVEVQAPVVIVATGGFVVYVLAFSFLVTGFTYII